MFATAAAIAALSAPRADVDLFSSYGPLSVELKAPFGDLFANARDDNDYAVSGSLSYSDANGARPTIEHIVVGLRGHTSRRETECSFPKLKLSVGSDSGDPLFGDGKTVKVGTHCDDKDDGLTPRFGRLANERSPWREAFAYRLLDALGVPTLKARPARITYVFTDDAAPDGNRSTRQQPLVRNGLLLEDDDDAKKRLSAAKDISEREFTTAADRLAPADTARLAFAEALLGNFDWCLKMTPDDTYRCDARHPLWNILAFVTGARVIPILYDFDVSGIVAGRHPWFADVYNEAFVPTRSHAAVEVLGQLQRTRSLFPRALLEETREQFVARKEAAYRALEGAAIDPEGRAIAREYLDSFFEAIRSDERFYLPVIAGTHATIWADAERTQPACGARSTAPIGTAVSEPLETRGNMVRVVVLDALWHWAPPNRCDAVHKDAVWVASNAISREYPR